MALAAEVLVQAAEHHASGHEQRDRAEWEEEEHRHEHDLGGDRVAVADREAHHRKHRVGAHERQRELRVECRPGLHENCQGHRHSEKCSCGCSLDGELPAAQRLRVGLVPGLAELLHGRREPGSEVLEGPHRYFPYRQERQTRYGRLLDGRTFTRLDGCP
jgi:hypothetical protein